MDYIFDTDALINLDSHFPNAFRRLKRLVAVKHARIPEGVYRELKRTSRLFRSALQWEQKHQWVVRIKNPILMAEFCRIEQVYGEAIVVGDRTYPGFWHSASGRKAADGQVVAMGKHFNAVIVSNDRAVRFACFLEDVECIGWSEFARRFGIASRQLALIP